MLKKLLIQCAPFIPKNKFVLISIIAGALILAFGISFFVTSSSCITVKQKRPVEGSQGYRVWFGDALQSFNHRGQKICVPDGWEALGATKFGDGWAQYEQHLTGILINKKYFTEQELTFTESNYRVRLLYTASASSHQASEYIRMVTNTFEEVGALYNDTPQEERIPHTVLVTAGLVGVYPNDTLIYPDPRETLTIFVRDHRDVRSEELLIHAVMHLYNRFREESTREYQYNQEPLGAEDFQELEATWAETALRISTPGRTTRLEYLYNVHTAVQTDDFSRITGPPFDEKRAFEQIDPSVIVNKNTSYSNAQYGHYILAPLSMVAVDGLLVQKNTSTDVQEILAKIHTHQETNFFDELRRYLSESDVQRVTRWMQNGETIPVELVESALAYYESKSR